MLRTKPTQYKYKQAKRKSTLRKQDALDVSVDLFSRAAARQGSFASAAGGRYSEQKELSNGLNFGV